MAKTRTIKEDCTRLAKKQEKAGLSQDKKRALGIYLNSLLQRVNSVEYAYRRVSNLSRATATESTDPILGSLAAELDFYCDAFWAFAYSTFDLVAHVVNVVHPRVQDERLVSFEKAKLDYADLGEPKKTQTSLPSALCHHMQDIARQDYYERLRKLRQCVLHRRVACLAPYSMNVPDLYNYNTTSTGPTLLGRFVCDDPDDLIPKFTEQRKLDDDCQMIKVALMSDLQKLLRKI